MYIWRIYSNDYTFIYMLFAFQSRAFHVFAAKQRLIQRRGCFSVLMQSVHVHEQIEQMAYMQFFYFVMHVVLRVGRD